MESCCSCNSFPSVTGNEVEQEGEEDIDELDESEYSEEYSEEEETPVIKSTGMFRSTAGVPRPPTRADGEKLIEELDRTCGKGLYTDMKWNLDNPVVLELLTEVNRTKNEAGNC